MSGAATRRRDFEVDFDVQPWLGTAALLVDDVLYPLTMLEVTELVRALNARSEVLRARFENQFADYDDERDHLLRSQTAVVRRVFHVLVTGELPKYDPLADKRAAKARRLRQSLAHSISPSKRRRRGEEGTRASSLTDLEDE